MEEKRYNKSVTMTMPKEYAEKFLAETKTSFMDCRYLNLMFKDMMFTAIYNQSGEEIKARIQKVLQEMKKYRDEEFKGMAQDLAYYKTYYKNNNERVKY